MRSRVMVKVQRAGAWLGMRFPKLNLWAKRNWWTIKASFLLVATVVWVCGSVFVVFSTVAAESERIERSDQNRELLLDLEQQGAEIKALSALALEVTGEDADRSQEEYFQRILTTADCNTVRRFNELVKGMEDEGLLTPGRIVISC